MIKTALGLTFLFNKMLLSMKLKHNYSIRMYKLGWPKKQQYIISHFQKWNIIAFIFIHEIVGATQTTFRK